MRRLIGTLYSLATIALLATPNNAALAASCADVTLPDQVDVDGTSLELNGLGLREATIFAVEVYVAGLYLESKTSDAKQVIESEQKKRLHLRFVRDLDRDDITGAWEEGFEKNAGNDLPKYKERVAKLNGWMTEVTEGQSLTFTYRPGAGVEVDTNGTVRGVVEGQDFAQVFFAIWFGPEPPNSGLKSGLLGGTCG